jgi:hypothetical protein
VTLLVSGGIEALFQEVMSEAAGLRKAVHAPSAPNVDPSVECGFFVKFIFLYDFFRDVTEFDFGKLGSFERHHEVEIGKVDAHESCTWGRNDTVEEYFDDE